MSQCCAVPDCKGQSFPLERGVKGCTDLSRLILMTQNHQHTCRLQRLCGNKMKGQT